MEVQEKEKAQRKARQSASLARKYQSVFGTNDGKAVLYDLMKAHGMLSSSYNGKFEDTVYNEGSRSVVLRIFKILNTQPEELVLMIDKLLNKEGEDELY